MQYPQTRYQDSLSVGITDTALSLTCASVPPTRTQGILTLGRLTSNTEDVLFSGVAGNVVTLLLRGLSQTALTPTEVVGNRKTHLANESVEITTHHNYDTDLLRKSEDDTITGNITFSNAPRAPGIKDANGNESLETPATASAVNQVRIANAATGNSPTISAQGDDTNIGIELQGKGTGVITIPDASVTKTAAAPTANAQIANKKYVDDQIIASGNLVVIDGSDTTAGNLDAKITAGSGITKTILNPGGNESLSLAADPTAFSLGFYPGGGVITSDVLGDAVSASDITNNLNLMYQLPSDMKWYKVTSTASTWYYRLALAIEAGTAGQTKRLLLKGPYQNQTYANINPTFSSALTGTDNSVGAATNNSARALLITNATGAEAVVTGGTISAKQTGTPAGAMLLYLVLENYEQANFPAAFKDTTANVVRGAIIGSATIAQALFSGTYQALAFSFGANVKIPAGARVFLVVAKTGAVDAGNFYQIQSNAATATLTETNQTWATAANAGNYTLTVTSTSPVGYAVKAYNGTNGGYSLTPTTAWSRPIGQVLSTTQLFFDPEQKFSSVDYTGYNHIATAASGFAQITTSFCPAQLRVTGGSCMDATTDVGNLLKGFIKGNSATVSSFQFDTVGNATPNTISFASSPAPLLAPFIGVGPLKITTGGSVMSQNRLHAVRLENGYYIWSSYPSGANFIGAGIAGFASTSYVFELEATL